MRRKIHLHPTKRFWYNFIWLPSILLRLYKKGGVARWSIKAVIDDVSPPAWLWLCDIAKRYLHAAPERRDAGPQVHSFSHCAPPPRTSRPTGERVRARESERSMIQAVCALVPTSHCSLTHSPFSTQTGMDRPRPESSALFVWLLLLRHMEKRQIYFMQWKGVSVWCMRECR